MPSSRSCAILKFLQSTLRDERFLPVAQNITLVQKERLPFVLLCGETMAIRFRTMRRRLGCKDALTTRSSGHLKNYPGQHRLRITASCNCDVPHVNALNCSPTEATGITAIVCHNHEVEIYNLAGDAGSKKKKKKHLQS